MRALCLFLLAFVSVRALAQTPATETEAPVEVRYEKRTVIEIGAATVEGTVVGPPTTMIRGGKRPAFKHLIRLRPDFRKELSATTDAISAAR